MAVLGAGESVLLGAGSKLGFSEGTVVKPSYNEKCESLIFRANIKTDFFRKFNLAGVWKGSKRETISQAQKKLSRLYKDPVAENRQDYSTTPSMHTHTSVAVTFSPSQSTLGRIFLKKEGLYSISDCSSSASRKCRGKDNEEDLHAFTAQVKKLTVSIFIFYFNIE